MNRIIKVIVCVLIMVGMLGSISVFGQIEKENLDSLIACGIVQGDPNGEMRLEENITRAEFAKIVCKMKGIPADEKMNTIFSDVAADYWASGYINTAYGLGIINGYEDGTFKPDNHITYAETVKMLVVALGYEPFAAQNGGYPHGYIKVAERYGIFGNVSCKYDEEATRGNVFELAYNSLNTPIMQQTTYGADAEYMILDGKNDVPLVTLWTLLGLD